MQKKYLYIPNENVNIMVRAKDKPEISWDNMSTIGKRAKIQFYVDADLVPRMRAISEMLSKTDAWRTNKQGKRKNTPGMYAEYCTRTILESVEQLIEKSRQESGETDARPQAAHNDG